MVVSLTVIGQRLAAMNLLSPLAISDEFSTVRLQHNRAFTELLHVASSSLYPQVIYKNHPYVVEYCSSSNLSTSVLSLRRGNNVSV